MITFRLYMRKSITFIALIASILIGKNIYSQNVNALSMMEYWFDLDYDSKIVSTNINQNTTEQILSVPTSTLKTGLHSFHVRYKDNYGYWSGTASKLFMKLPVGDKNNLNIIGYEYWVDNNIESKISVTVPPTQTFLLSEAIDFASLPDGLHSFHVRFKDSGGFWSSVSSNFFMKLPETDQQENKITSFRYWINKDESNIEYVQLLTPSNPFELVKTLKTSLNNESVKVVNSNNYEFQPNPVTGNRAIYYNNFLFNIQFKDSYGYWSSVASDTIIYGTERAVQCNLLSSKIPETKVLSKSDTIHFFSMKALEGDSLILKLDKPLIIDLYDPFGRKINTILAGTSTQHNGFRAKLDGEYFALVRGFNKTLNGNYTINYTHIAKYSVLGWNLKKVGNKGTSVLILEGNGFTSLTKVKLVRPEIITLTPDTVICSSLSLLRSSINFNNVPIGFYDIVVDFGDTIITIINGVEVEGNKPIELDVTIIGPPNFRSGAPVTYTLQVVNNGNRTGYLIPLDIEIRFKTENGIKNIIIGDKIDRKGLVETFYDSDNVDDEILEMLSEFDRTYSDFKDFILLQDSKSGDYFLKGQLTLPYVDANSIKNIPLSLQSTSNIEVIASVPEKWDLQEMFINKEMVKKIECSVDLIECLISIVSPIEKPNSTCMKESIVKLMTPDREGKFSYLLTGMKALEKGISEGKSFLSITSQISADLLGSMAYEFTKVTIECMLQSKIDKTILKTALRSTIFFKAFDVGKTCIPAIVNATVGNCFGNNSESTLPGNVVQSRDPNDKIGYRSPSGSKSFNAEKKNFTYIVNFENKDSATAPAQEVYITDTLDLNQFDIESFKAGYIKIGEKIVQAPFDAQEHTWKVDMRPEMNLMTEVHLTLDKVKGIVHWYFKAIDPMTETLPTDPFVGFLPPNDSIGSGQGCVSFSIDLKDNIEDGTNIDNRASIVFDYNEPILTPTWSNVKDITSPISAMLEPKYANDSVAIIRWQADDNIGGSGVYCYNLYEKKEDSVFVLLYTKLSKDSFVVDLEKNVDYYYYVTAVDSAGNAEFKKPNPEVHVKYRQANTAPVAKSGADLTVNEGEVVFVDGSASYDAERDSLAFHWIVPAGIVLSSNSTVRPNFTAPEVSANTNYVFSLFVNDGNVNSKPDTVLITVLNNNKINQKMKFKFGWNIFSVTNYPEKEDMDSIFQPLITNGSLVKIQDESGSSLEDLGIFGKWKNNIGDVTPTEGYKIKVSKDDTLKVSGTPVEYPYAIPLKKGWNIAGYPQQTDFSGMNLVQQLADKGTLIKVQDEGGNSIEDWGIYGSWQNNIGNFMAGEGYKIKVSADDTLWIYDNYPNSSAILPEFASTTHFKRAFEGYGFDHMNINLVGLHNNIFQAGDELAIFDGATCVGAATLMPHHLESQTISIATSATDNLGMPGFAEGNPFVLKLWNSKNSQEFKIAPEIVKGTSTFIKNETSVVSLEKYTTIGFEGLFASEQPEINCYPNPFNDEITIEINLFKETEVQVEVLNQLGQLVKYINTGEQLNRGSHRLIWDGTNSGRVLVAPGIYLIRMKLNDTVYYSKVIYSK